MMSIKDIYQVFKTSTGVCTDTRQIKKDGLFFALRGANFNGNLFASQALEHGAVKVVVDDADVAKNENYILVENVLATLQELATFHRRELNIPIVGITGTNGKTTTKELVKTVLDKKYRSFATVGNFNNHIGVPLTLLSIDEKIEIAVVEMGANHPGEIDFLCKIAEPNVGLITNVGKAHLEGFGSFEGVKKTKGELYRFIESKQGLLFVNKSNTHLLGMLNSGAELFYYGHNTDCKVRVTELRNTPNLSFGCKINEEEIHINAQLMGGYNLENALAAISVGTYFGVEPHKIAEAINEYTPENNRSQMVISDKNKILFDAYNANPTSMKAALENFVALNEKNKVAILGEMKELGDDSRQEHMKVLHFLRNKNLTDVYLVGENYKSMLQDEDGFKWADNVNVLIEEIATTPIRNSFILVKGSRSNKLELLKGIL
ncbi:MULTISPECIES: UDP-N-acetylmuramoyl-tripeptide--D-alanyl-D-alanine ligase [unclassified Saccharicrinis]|uniref:UDP-N-acetylmuramoyl-tripeptide--D-alanyl-D- alanine ligase n=1 Tax=unclassified Saccharicrinis TaxID=2646859 RepID=UPI003D328F25